MNELDTLFLNSTQIPQKLDIAVRRYFSDSSGLTDRQKEQYRAFLKARSFNTCLLIAREFHPDVMERFLAEHWLSAPSLDRALEESDLPLQMRVLLMREAAEDAAQHAQARTLFSGTPAASARERFSENAEQPEPSSSQTGNAEEILSLTQLRLFEKLSGLRLALSALTPCRIGDPDTAGTDGESFFYGERLILTRYSEGRLERLWLHTILHCLWQHLTIRPETDPDLWNIACDISAAYLAEELLGPDSSESGMLRRELCETIRTAGADCSRAASVYRYLADSSSATDHAELSRLFAVDDHRFWRHASGTGLNRFRLFQKKIGDAAVPVHKRPGVTPGSRTERMILNGEARCDFRSWLRKFTVTAEEMQTDPGSFDYLPYLYGLEHYGNLPLIEPLEYTEADKVSELVIAIDTSGSCDTATVQRFLAETRRILTDRQNFFRRMNVHILQCDSMIQEHAVINSREEWNDYIRSYHVSGRGGTDFTPVFDYTDRLIADGVFRNLKGLLYFTDGDGVYPKKQPSYETAFVFTDRSFFGHPSIPSWAVQLCLQ